MSLVTSGNRADLLAPQARGPDWEGGQTGLDHWLCPLALYVQAGQVPPAREVGQEIGMSCHLPGQVLD